MEPGHPPLSVSLMQRQAGGSNPSPARPPVVPCDPLPQMGDRETSPSVRLMGGVTGNRESSIKIDDAVFACHFCLKVNKNRSQA